MAGKSLKSKEFKKENGFNKIFKNVRYKGAKKEALLNLWKI